MQQINSANIDKNTVVKHSIDKNVRKGQSFPRRLLGFLRWLLKTIIGGCFWNNILVFSLDHQILRYSTSFFSIK